MLQSIKDALPPINREGYIFIAIFAFVSCLLGVFSVSLFWIGAGLTLWCALFFRDPERITPLDENIAVSPADGTICFIGQRTPPPELGLGESTKPCVSVFMNVFNVHVNRAPVSGDISKISYKEGAFFNADLDKASEKNERNSFLFETKFGTVAAVQIAGLVARRIVVWAEQGDAIEAGERIGMIRFGSRVDVYFPDKVDIQVQNGQTMIAGETILAIFNKDQQQRQIAIS